jgi:probable rRNA maturation factor
MSLHLDLQIASTDTSLPTEAEIHQWAQSTLPDDGIDYELSVRIVDEQESQDLNNAYRKKNKPTNVLSFPADLPEEVELSLLGDLVICAPIVRSEAATQTKDLTAHWAHMVIHGTLHLQGYDHQSDADAEVMENLETEILIHLGYSAPYLAVE